MTFIAIGGAEDKEKDLTVLKRVVAETGKDAPRVCVITTATEYPDDAKQRYIDALAKMRCNPFPMPMWFSFPAATNRV